MTQKDLQGHEQDLRRIIRGEIESFVTSSPHWLTERVADELSTAIARKLNERTVRDVTAALVQQLEQPLCDAVLAKLAETVDRAYLRAVAGRFADEFALVYEQLEQLRKSIAETNADNWWRRGGDAESGDEDSV